jgi:hypothetical protein
MRQELLKDGPVDAKEGEEAAKANGISGRTLDRARDKLGITATKAGYEEGWQWSLPK